MRKFVKKIVIGTAAALLVTTGVFASGWENAAESQASGMQLVSGKISLL